jgi:hypothetical protein
MSRVYLFTGDNGTGKTSCALGDNPEDIVDFYEFDAGSFDRAAAAMDNLDRISVKRYYAPLTNLLDQGKISVGSGGGIAPATVHRLEGWKDKFWEFVADYLAGLKGNARPVIDTETKLWLMIRQGFLEEVQDATGPNRERLDQLQYTEPNARHSQLIEAAKQFNKDLVMLAHEKEQYIKKEATGVMIPDGFKEVPNMADAVLRFRLVDRKPVATFTKAGAGGLDLLGVEIVEPTLPLINDVLDAAAKLRKAGQQVPRNAMDIIVAGAKI